MTYIDFFRKGVKTPPEDERMLPEKGPFEEGNYIWTNHQFWADMLAFRRTQNSVGGCWDILQEWNNVQILKQSYVCFVVGTTVDGSEIRLTSWAW